MFEIMLKTWVAVKSYDPEDGEACNKVGLVSAWEKTAFKTVLPVWELNWIFKTEAGAGKKVYTAVKQKGTNFAVCISW